MLFREYFCFNALILNPISQKPPGPSGPGDFIQPITNQPFLFYGRNEGRGYHFAAGAGRRIMAQGLKSGMMARAARSGALRTSLLTSKIIVAASSGV